MNDQGYGYARQRAGAVVRAMLDGGASEDAALKAGDRTFNDAVKIATGERSAKAATAASVTQKLRAEIDDRPDGKAQTMPAVRYALDQSVTGGLVRLTMRVKPGQRLHDTDRPKLSTDGGAERIRAARGVACSDLTRAFACRSRASGAARKALTAQIRAIVRIWHDDPTVAEICRANDWSIKDR